MKSQRKINISSILSLFGFIQLREEGGEFVVEKSKPDKVVLAGVGKHDLETAVEGLRLIRRRQLQDHARIGGHPDITVIHRG